MSPKPSSHNQDSFSRKGKLGENQAIDLPSVSLPKGGGTLKGIDEKFRVNPVNGSASLSVPIPLSPGRNGFGPATSLSYNSGAGNGPFGLGWQLSLPSIQIKTDQALPTYSDKDVYLLSDAEDLVPLLERDSNGQWQPWQKESEGFTVSRFRPRMEGLFSRIEKITHPGQGVYWKVTSKNNITTFYGKNESARIADPQNPNRIFKWLADFSYDDKGNWISYDYKAEDLAGVPDTSNEMHRKKGLSPISNRYLKSIRYGNFKAWYPDPGKPYDLVDPSLSKGSEEEMHAFELVFDYGEHHPETPAPSEEQGMEWDYRADAFSTYRSGFEIRTRRLCKRILMFHKFPELGDEPCLVRAVELSYSPSSVNEQGRSETTYLSSAVQSGYIRKPDGSYSKKSLPPLRFSYQQLHWDEKIHKVSEQALENSPEGLGTNYYWMDLYGEGISGILYEQENNWYYKQNLGDSDGEGADFSPMQPVSARPSLRGLSNAALSLQDLEGNGRKQWVVNTKNLKGFYDVETQDTAQMDVKSFRPFRSYPNFDSADPNTRYIDLNGDGRPELLISEENAFLWYENLGKKGYAEGGRRIHPLDEEKGPAMVFADSSESIYLADFTGDGLTDIARIRNGEACYWPNLGYGNFGAKVTMQNAPLFDFTDSFHPSFLHLADISGTGTTDLVYLGKNSFKAYLNLSGNGWSEAHETRAFFPVDQQGKLSVIDLLGTGTACIVWSSGLPGQHAMQYIDLMGSKKPHVLTGYSNSMGKELSLSYKNSTWFYLKDKKEGNPWLTKLPFPVHVIEKSTLVDHISSTELTTRYSYHHGYYDYEEREFRGFGRVDQTDSESFDSWKGEDALDMPPILTRTWVHTGSYKDQGKLSRLYRQEYYSDDAVNHEFPDSVLENSENFSYREYREAVRCLKGVTLRQEVYSLDGSDKEAIPYSISESNFTLRQVQPHSGISHGVYQSLNRESLTYTSERNTGDPRIGHQFALQHDEYGYPLQLLSVAYPRRKGIAGSLPEQQRLYVSLQTLSYEHETEAYYRLGLPLGQREYEIGGLPLVADAFFSFEALREEMEQVFVENRLLAHHEEFGSGVQARLLGAQNSYYKQASLKPLALPDYSEQMVMSEIHAAQSYDGRAEDSHFEEAGYLKKDGAWWVESDRPSYLGADDFYLPYQTEDVFGNRSEIVYDQHHLAAKEAVDALGNRVFSEIDYRTLSVVKITDINDSVSEAISDELGMVVATTVYGTEEGVQKGDSPMNQYARVQDPSIDDIVVHPLNYLQGATAFFYYHLEPWEEGKLPPHFVQLQRETHVSELPAGEETAVQISLGYSDGLGRELQSKIKHNPGHWLVSGRTIYNNKQKPVKQYEPFFADSHVYQPEEEIGPVGVTPVLYYDALGRLIKTETPDGFFTKVEFDPWQLSSYDQNDTVSDSLNYAEHSSLPAGDPKKMALDKAAPHYNTPTTVVLDSLGREFRIEQVKEEGGEPLISYSELDISGNVIRQADPRQYSENQNRPEAERIYNFTYSYDMAGNVLRTHSQDAGTSYTLINAKAKPLYTWNARDYRTRVVYDPLFRPVETRVEGPGLDISAQKIVYGTDRSKNQNGQAIVSFDPAGKTENLLFDFKGQLLQNTRQLCRDYKTEPDWADESAVPMEAEVYRSEFQYDALGRVIKTILADGSVHLPVYHPGGWLKGMEVKLRGRVFGNESTENPGAFVENIEYDAKGQRTQIRYGNGVSTSYSYDEKNFRLTRILTQRQESGGGQTILQDISYVFDPVGNVIRITDQSHERVFHAGQQVDPDMQYVYDALYQLEQATGREHLALQKNSHQHHSEIFKETQFAQINNAGQLGNYSRRYSYDDSGNLVQVRHSGGSSFTRNIRSSATSNRAVSDEDDSSLPVDAFFDAAGNLLQLEHLAGISWDYRNQMTSATLVERQVEDENGLPVDVSDAEYYVYDASGQRSRKVRESYTSSGELLWTEEKIYLGGVEIKRKFQGNARTLKENRSSVHVMDDQKRISLVYYWEASTDASVALNRNKIHYQMGNHLGSASLELDDQGRMISYEEYYPFGGTAFTAGENLTEVKRKEYRYTGKERDDTTGLYYYGARYYAPWLGRWMNPDPAGTVDGMNLFYYVANNPVNRYDSTGNFYLLVWGTLGQYVKQFITGEPAKPIIRKDGTVDISATAEGTVYTAGTGAALMGGIIVGEAGLAYYGVTSSSVFAGDVALGTSLATGGVEILAGDAAIGVGVDDAVGLADNVVAKLDETVKASQADDAFRVMKIDTPISDEGGEMAFEIIEEGSGAFSGKAAELLETSSKSSFRRRIPRAIHEEGADHPYSGFVAFNDRGRPVNATAKPKKGGTHAWMQGQPTYWEAGHPVSDKIEGDMLSLQFGYYNQTLGQTVEKARTGGYKLTSVLEVQGIPVDAATARYLDSIGEAPIPQGLDSLPVARPEVLYFDTYGGDHVQFYYLQRNPERFQGR